jgi:hypothetical protein
MNASWRARLRYIWIVSGCLYGASGFGQALEQLKDAADLQRAFARSADYKLINKVSEIPEPGRQILTLVARHGLMWNGKPTLADMGEDWSTDDSRIETLPWGQHRFSAISDEFIAIVFVVGGGAAQHQLILARPRAHWFCWFKLPDLSASKLRLSIVRDHIEPDRDQTISKSPKCQPNPLAPATFHLSE